MINIQPVEVEGTFWLNLSMDGQPMAPRGPWSNASEAEAMAVRLAGVCTVLRQPVTIGARRRVTGDPLRA